MNNVPYEIFLIGDTGSISRNKPDQVLEMLKAHCDVNQESAIVFLGDNIYPRGLPAKDHLLRKEAEDTLNAHKNALKDYHGKVLFISGNHDWNKGRADGYEYVLRQQKYLDKLFGTQVMFPSNGCPGPSEINVNDNITIVLINTQWWLQSGYRPIGKECGCRVNSEEDFFIHLRKVLDKNKGKQIIVAGHAPVYSYAIHGGRYKFSHHLFPMTIYHRKAYVPLPLIGSLLPLYRKYFGAKEDIAHPRYRHLRKKLKEVFKEYPGLIYAAGHEHNLQHISKDHNHFIISGAGSKLKYVLKGGKNLRFGMKAKGFFKIRFESDGSVVSSAWILDPGHNKGKMVYEQPLN
ncbi:metallophosphoesterase [Daejeonella oryzae]|uniref:metallophosphoesterase n=1 Tax=Daejeonella oryzae TaxID=1122943 RepID=UPI0004273509|nr:metallophosphoesterase [Daejeonella oryzae]